MLKIVTPVHPPVSREEYTLRSIGELFPSGEWVAEEVGGGALPQGTEDPSPASPSITVIGGTKYDKDALTEYLRELPDGTTVIVGAGRGVESDLAKDESVQVVDVDVDMYGDRARTVNVEDVLAQDIRSPVLLVGAGERVKQAKSWLSRASWPREVVVI